MSGLKRLLEGRPFRSPLHPALVHLPIALFPISLLMDAFSHFCPMNELYFVRGAYATLLAGIATGLLAAGFGFVDFLSLRRDHPARKTAVLHMVLNVGALALFGASAWLRRAHLDGMTTGSAPLWVSLTGLVVLGYSGYLGGHLVYGEGAAVGRHRRRTPPPNRTVHATTSGGAAVVGNAVDVGEGETLRAEIDGIVVTVARVNGKLHAFQEFCTHRYGPLSEGRLADCEVTCPWHGSRFDVRTGRVTAGPAKVDLRTFRVEVKEGKIRVLVRSGRSTPDSSPRRPKPDAPPD